MVRFPRRNDISAPKWIKPELTRLVDEAPSADGWLHEIKYDGYRASFIEGFDAPESKTREELLRNLNAR